MLAADGNLAALLQLTWDKVRPGDLIGIKTEDPMEAVAAKVSAALGPTLLPRESSQWGDPYYSGRPESEVKLTANLDPSFTEGNPPDEQWFESAAREVPYLLWEADDATSAMEALSLAGLDAMLIMRHS